MTPKEKAERLYYKFFNALDADQEVCAKQCALIAVDEIIELYPSLYSGAGYWQKVKQEIENL